MSNDLISNEVMQTAVKEMIEKIRTSMDFDSLRDYFSELQGLKPIDNIEFQDGVLSSLENKVALKFDYKVTLTVPIYLDLKGDFIIPQEESEKIDQNAVKPEDLIEKAGYQAAQSAESY